MNSLPLTGLHGTHPLGAMAAFGLLRVVSHRNLAPEPKLAWHRGAGFVAVLCTSDRLEKESLLDSLTESMTRRSEAPIFDEPDIKMSLDDFCKFRRTATAADDEAAAFFAAFGSEVVPATTGNVKPTAFHFTAGQQKLLNSAQELARSLDPTQKLPRRLNTPREAFERALFGPWTYEDPYHSLGWDPGTEALHALSDRAPTDAGPVSERAAVWLGFEALPLFPCFPGRRRNGLLNLHTRGFDPRGRRFRWPLWWWQTDENPAPAISLDTLATLLSLADLYDDQPDAQKLAARGVVAVYESAVARDGNGRGTFRHPKLVCSAT